MPKTREFDAAAYLDSPVMIAEYLTEALETDDEVFIAKAIGTIARAQGMSAVADSAGVSRENLYRALRTVGWVEPLRNPSPHRIGRH